MKYWHFHDPQKVLQRIENEHMMKDPKVRQWARKLSLITDRGLREEFLKEIPEEYQEAVEVLARCGR